MERLVHSQVELVARRFRRLRLWRNLTVCWLSLTLTSGTAFLFLALTGSAMPPFLGPLAAAAGLMIIVSLWNASRQARDLHETARHIEQQFPDLKDCLLAAIEQHRQWPEGRFGYLQQQVVRQALAHSRHHSWADTVPSEKLSRARVFHWAALVILGIVVVNVRHVSPAGLSRIGLLAVGSSLEYDVAIEPGDAQIERGTDLLVVARFAGALPPEVILSYASAAKPGQTVTLGKSLGDPIFGGRIPSVSEAIDYRVEFAGQKTKDFHVTVFDYPALERADAKLSYPKYTGADDKTIEDTRQVSAVEGTQVAWSFLLNKPVASAQLVPESGPALALQADSSRLNTYTAQWQINEDLRYKLQLVDADGRANRFETEIVAQVVRNRPPDLKLAFPGRDLQVSPLQEVDVQASAWDDFGVREYGLTYQLAGMEPTTVVLGASAPAKEKLAFEHLVSLEKLEAEPDHLLAYYLWADDVGPDGELRRTSGDMYFAEVRRFDEIFRQGQQPPGGQSQNRNQQQGRQGGATTKLADLQKQIINATWNLLRQQKSQQPTKTFDDDVGVIRESQQNALVEAGKLKERARDGKSKSMIVDVENFMTNAIEHLIAAGEYHRPDSLKSALSPEQSAYQALLKLRAHEFRVIRQQQQQAGGGGGGGGNRNQQQMQQLQLDNKRNRYETRRAAANNEQQGADRETNQVLNRLRELARRQSDVNRRVQELQTALQAAETEQEKEEIRRQLKRLREEEQEMLRDLDDLRNRMNRPENQQRMADAQRELERSRENVRRASEALEQGMVSQALTSGTRAERELQQLRDDFRERNARQFSEEMKEMRREARELAENQEDVGKQLDKINQQARKSLRDTGERKELADRFDEQQKQLGELLEEMKDVSQKAEQAEPLLAKHLYDTVRKASQKKVDQSLDIAGELLRRGFLPEAEQVERQARQGVDEVRRGVERAAESVLGNEVDALRRAQQELTELTDAMQRELARADGTDPRQAEGNEQRGEQGRSPASKEQSGARKKAAGRPGARSRAQNGPDQQGGRGSENERQENRGPSRKSAKADRQGSGTPKDGGASRQQSPSNARGSGKAAGKEDAPGRRGGGQTQPGLRSGGGDRQRTAKDGGGIRLPFQDREGVASAPGGPITGPDYREWSDRMRDVEEMLDDPGLRGEVARIRDLTRAARAEFRRHSKAPNWSMVRKQIVEPMVELQGQIGEVIARKGSDEKIVPIDRDPVPQQFADLVRRYYEKLGSGK